MITITQTKYGPITYDDYNVKKMYELLRRCEEYVPKNTKINKAMKELFESVRMEATK